jgi:hypothetical protein
MEDIQARARLNAAPVALRCGDKLLPCTVPYPLLTDPPDASAEVPQMSLVVPPETMTFLPR